MLDLLLVDSEDLLGGRALQKVGELRVGKRGEWWFQLNRRKPLVEVDNSLSLVACGEMVLLPESGLLFLSEVVGRPPEIGVDLDLESLTGWARRRFARDPKRVRFSSCSKKFQLPAMRLEVQGKYLCLYFLEDVSQPHPQICQSESAG